MYSQDFNRNMLEKRKKSVAFQGDTKTTFFQQQVQWPTTKEENFRLPKYRVLNSHQMGQSLADLSSIRHQNQKASSSSTGFRILHTSKSQKGLDGKERNYQQIPSLLWTGKISSNDSQLETSNMEQSRSSFQTQPKLSKQQVIDNFYKKKEQNDIMLMPLDLKNQEFSFKTFKELWINHQKQSEPLLQQQSTQVSRQQSSKFRGEQNEISQNHVSRNSPRTVINHRRSVSEIKSQESLNIQQKGKEGEFFHEDQENHTELRVSSSQLQSASGGGERKRIAKSQHTSNGILQVHPLSHKDEIRLQLNQNKHSQGLYGINVFELEQEAFQNQIGQINLSKSHLGKIQKRTKIYNKNNLVESLDPANQSHQTSSIEGKPNEKKQVKQINDREFTSSRQSISYCWLESEKDTWKPMPRVGTTLNCINSRAYSRRILMIGGISSEMVKDVFVIDPETYAYETLKHFEEQIAANSNEYERDIKRISSVDSIQNVKIKSNMKKNALVSSPKNDGQDLDDLFNKYMYQNKDGFSQRYNHTAVEIMKRTRLLIFGGEILLSEQLHQNSQPINSMKSRPHHRNCQNDLISFDLETRKWKGHMGRGEIIEARRNHTANMVGQKHMVVIGGLNSEGRALDDLFILDISTFRWVNINVLHNKYVHVFPTGIAFHAACFVSDDENSPSINIAGNAYFTMMQQQQQQLSTANSANNLNSNSNNNNKRSSSNQNGQGLQNASNSSQSSLHTFIKEEGLYVFGGIDGSGTYLKNKMYVLKQNLNPPQWIELSARGKPPERRCGHSLNFIYNMSILSVYGGKFETDSMTKYYDDLHVLNLKSLEWLEVILEGQRRPPRALHSSCVNRKQLIIFGGINEKGFLKGNIDIIEFDQNAVSKLRRQHNFSREQPLEQTKLVDLTTQRQSKSSNQFNKLQSVDQPIPQLTTNNIQMMMRIPKEKCFIIDPQQERELENQTNTQSKSKEHSQREHNHWKPPQKQLKESEQQINGINSAKASLNKSYLPPPLKKQ